MHNRRTLHALTIVAALASAVAVSHGVASDCDTSPAAVCSRCGEKVCVTFVSPAAHTESCYEVECDEVCVPAMRFPWHRGKKAECGDCVSDARPGCGKVRGVGKLKEVVSKCDTCRSGQRVVCCCPKCGPIPHGKCGCLPPLASASAGDRSPPVEQAETTATKPHWSDRLRSRVVNWQESFGPQPNTTERDLSRLIGHSRFGAEQSE